MADPKSPEYKQALKTYLQTQADAGRSVKGKGWDWASPGLVD